MKWLVCVLIFSIPICLPAQLHTDRHAYYLFDEELQPIHHANIYIASSGYLTQTDLSGYFEIDETGLNPTDTIFISALGYESMTLSLGDLQTLQGVFLSENRIALHEIEVVAERKKSRYRKAGTTGFSKIFYMEWNTSGSDSLNNYQIGKLVRFRQDSIFLSSIHFHLNNTAVDSASFLVSAYRIQKDSGKISETCIAQPVIVRTSIVAGWNTIDLAPYLIKIPGMVLVSLQYIPAQRKTPLFFFSTKTLPGNDTFLKPIKNGSWMQSRTCASIYVTGRLVR